MQRFTNNEIELRSTTKPTAMGSTKYLIWKLVSTTGRMHPGQCKHSRASPCSMDTSLLQCTNHLNWQEAGATRYRQLPRVREKCFGGCLTGTKVWLRTYVCVRVPEDI